jgi:hypothetical protein
MSGSISAKRQWVERILGVPFSGGVPGRGLIGKQKPPAPPPAPARPQAAAPATTTQPQGIAAVQATAALPAAPNRRPPATPVAAARRPERDQRGNDSPEERLPKSVRTPDMDGNDSPEVSTADQAPPPTAARAPGDTVGSDSTESSESGSESQGQQSYPATDTMRAQAAPTAAPYETVLPEMDSGTGAGPNYNPEGVVIGGPGPAYGLASDFTVGSASSSE